MSHALSLMAAALAGQPAPDPPETLRDALVAMAIDQGVAPLLAVTPAAGSWHPTLRAALHRAAVDEAARALGRSRELHHVIEALSAARVPALVIKGGHLAHAVYPDATSRPHGDIDLLIAEATTDRARRALEAAGYQRLAHVTGEVAFTQVHYWRLDDTGMRHAVDLHWKIAAPRAFAECLPWDRLYAGRTSLPALHPAACAPGDAHALLLACIHRTAHHRNSDRLIWLYDIHLLASRLTAPAWSEVVAIAGEQRLGAITAGGLGAAARWLGTAVPAAVSAQLAAAPTDPAFDVWLDPAHTPLDELRADWRAVHGWRRRLRFAREHLFPAPAYMETRFGARRRVALPFLYLYRLVTGAWKWM